MIIVIHGPAGTGKSTTCKLLFKKYFQNKSAYYDLDHVTQNGTQSERCQQVVEMVRNHPLLNRNYHYFINWVFESPQVMRDFIGKLGLLSAQQEVRGLIINARAEIRMNRLENRKDKNWVQEQSTKAATMLDEAPDVWAKMGPTIDTSDEPENEIAEKIISFMQSK